MFSNNNMIILENYLASSANKKLQYNVLNETEKRSLATSMIMKVLDKIKAKYTKINYSSVEKTKGNFTKFKDYKLVETSVLNLYKLYLSNPTEAPLEIVTLNNALHNLVNVKNIPIFQKAFAENNAVGKMLYNTVAFAIISGAANIVATCLECKKTNFGCKFIFKANKKPATKYFKQLSKFNKMAITGELRELMNKKLLHESVNENNEYNVSLLNEDIVAIVGMTFGVLSVIWLGITIIRELCYLYYFERKEISNDLKELAHYLKIHEEEIKNNNAINSTEKKDILKRQEKIINFINDMADYISPETEKAEQKTDDTINDEDNDLKNSSYNNDQSSANNDGLLI